MRSEYLRGILKFGIAAAMIAVAMVCRYLTKTEDLSDLVWNALSLLLRACPKMSVNKNPMVAN